VINRLLRIIGAYLAACFAAGLVVAVEVMLLNLIALPLEGRSLSNAPVAASPAYALLLLTWLTGILAVTYAFLPAAIAIAIAEVRDQRAAGFYGGAGILTAAVAWGIFVSRSSLGMPHRWEVIPRPTRRRRRAGGRSGLLAHRRQDSRQREDLPGAGLIADVVAAACLGAVAKGCHH
jgi:hypothetical protein